MEKPAMDERRAVALRLRGYDCPVLPSHQTTREAVDAAVECMGLEDDEKMWTVRYFLDRLADLIDPGEPKVKCVAEVKVDGERLEKLAHDAAAELTGIDRDALLALADKLDKDAVNIISAARNAQFTGGGPRMEEAKHDAYEWRQIARSIRKALGVES